MSNFVQRLLSALILAPLFIYICYMGGNVFYALTAILFSIMFYEWVSITSKSSRKILWWILGFLYIGFAGIIFVIVREYYPLVVFFSIVAMVWINDIFGYIFGKTIGGPKLCPAISPKKTWSGALGGIIGCVGSFFIFNYANSFGAGQLPDRSYYLGLLFVTVIPIISQIGDLLESYIKRKFGVKDSGNIIPGHGGFLDRFDGLLLVLNVVGIYFYVTIYLKVLEQSV